MSDGEKKKVPHCVLTLSFPYSTADVAALRWGYKKGLELVRRLGVYRGPLAPAHPQFAAGSPAATALAENGPVALDAPKIIYSKEDDEAIEANIRNFGEFRFWLSNLILIIQKTTRSVATTWHSVGHTIIFLQRNADIVW